MKKPTWLKGVFDGGKTAQAQKPEITDSNQHYQLNEELAKDWPENVKAELRAMAAQTESDTFIFNTDPS